MCCVDHSNVSYYCRPQHSLVGHFYLKFAVLKLYSCVQCTYTSSAEWHPGLILLLRVQHAQHLDQMPPIISYDWERKLASGLRVIVSHDVLKSSVETH